MTDLPQTPPQSSSWPPFPTQPPEPQHRRARRPVALIVAVAIAAAAIGGGAATLLDGVTGQQSAPASQGVRGTTVSTSSAGTVAGVAQAVSPSIVEISANTGAGASTGSGVIISEDGEVITNNHVVSGAAAVKVQLSDGKSYDAEVTGTDASKDLALIKIKGASGLKPAALGDSSKLRVGEEVVAIGSPEGLTGTVTSGIVSALDRDVTVGKERESQQQEWPFEFGGQEFNGDTGDSKTTYKAIQTDASLNPGNSGGALINMRGEIIGINSAMYAPSAANGSAAGSVGLGFAIPVNTMKDVLGDLRSGESI
ncbi:S1C family serine protease [Streptomyces sp. NPDC059256]|uniref:S1C family serine protease n=1 Tax=Streptomyces sp. NPDC059256 TaxID=3346794 RepID=UPI0036AC383B